MPSNFDSDIVDDNLTIGKLKSKEKASTSLRRGTTLKTIILSKKRGDYPLSVS
jgi:hypothetical protein